MMYNQAATEGPLCKTFQCSHCATHFKSKAFLFEHLNAAHGLNEDSGLRDSDLTSSGSSTASTDCSGSTQLCDSQTCGPDVFSKHQTECREKSENLKGSQHNEAAESGATSTSKAKGTLNLSKDLKTYKKPQQTIAKYFKASSGTEVKPAKNATESQILEDDTRGTLILQKSPSSASPASSGVLKVTAKPAIDISNNAFGTFLRSDHLLITELRPQKPKGLIEEPCAKDAGKSERPKSKPVKIANTDKEEMTGLPEMKQESSKSTDFSFEVSEDDDEKGLSHVIGDSDGSEMYFCKHCDYSGLGIQNVFTHYKSDHPYVRCNLDYIQDPSDRSATFRCLQCPVEFPSVADLERHSSENHAEGPDVFALNLRELRLVFKCFVCPFTTNVLKALRGHYKEKHPVHRVDNSLMYSRYLESECQEGSSQRNACETLPSFVRSGRTSPERGPTPCEEVKKASSSQHHTSKGADGSLYQCTHCKFSHKSVIVMHVHYQRNHPEETVTIDKLKQSACVTLHPMPEVMAESLKSEMMADRSTPQPKSSKSKEATMTQQKLSFSLMSLERSPKAVEDSGDRVTTPARLDRNASPEAASSSPTSPDTLFYCQFCSYSSTKIKSVVCHHNAKHTAQAMGIEQILKYNAELKNKTHQTETEASQTTTSSDSKSSEKTEGCDGNELQHQDKATVSHPYARAEDLFYCQKCNYGNPAVKGILIHQYKIHPSLQANVECIMEHTALTRDQIKKSKSRATRESDSSLSSDLPLPLISEGDKNVFFCHMCNYRHSTLSQVVHHCFKVHRGLSGAKTHKVRMYTSMVLEQIRKLHPKTTTTSPAVNQDSVGEKGTEKKRTKEPAKSSPDSLPSMTRAPQTQKTLQCHKCSYSTQHVYLLRRHTRKMHKAHCSATDMLRVCLKQGHLQSGYHCDLCVFSHKKAAVLYKHYQKQHPERRASLEFVTSQLYVAPETSSSKKKRTQTRQMEDVNDGDGDGSVQAQRSGQNEIKRYSCRACSFKGNSLSSITHHYRAVHPWSVKEDGSVPDVISRKRQSANRLGEEPSEMPESFNAYQAPLEFDKSSDSSHDADVSSTILKCPYCPVRFHTQHGLSTHCGMKHHNATAENLQQQEQVKRRVHVFKCQHCAYVNSSYHGVLTHSQMKHSMLEPMADSFHVDETHLHIWDNGLKGKGPGDILRFRGFKCKICPQIHATLEKMNKHCEKDHDQTVTKTSRPSCQPAVSKMQQSSIQSAHRSMSKTPFYKKKGVIRCQHCAYSCSTRIAMARHFKVAHKSVSASEVPDHVYKCALCSNSYFKKTRLGCHYTNKHGKDAFLKYYAAVYERPSAKTHVSQSTWPTEDTSEACHLSTVSDKDKILVYKCPRCPYVNASPHGTLTHCQMVHPSFTARAGRLQTDEILLTNMVRCPMGKGSNERGFMCKRCPQIHASLKKLKIHCERDHHQAFKFGKEKQPLSKSPDSQHAILEEASLQEHSGVSATTTEPGPQSPKREEPGDQDFTYKCTLCSYSTLIRKRLAAHYTSTHGKTDFLQQFAKMYQKRLKKLQRPSPDLAVTRQPANSPGARLPPSATQELAYKCHICDYVGICRKYLGCHYKNKHKFDGPTTCKFLQKYNKYKGSKDRSLPAAESDKSAQMKCKKCPDLIFDSSQLLIAHYSSVHGPDCWLDFTVLYPRSKRTTGVYECVHCKARLNGIRQLCSHLDRHRNLNNEKAKKAASLAVPLPGSTSPEADAASVFQPCKQDVVPTLETVEELARFDVAQQEALTFTASPLKSPPKPADQEEPEPESSKDRRTCKQCVRTFMSLKGLRCHERSHAALAAIKKLDSVTTSVVKQNINKYLLYKPGTLRPFLCSICSYRTPVMGLWTCHFMKKHQDVVDCAATDNQDSNSQMADKEPPTSSGEPNNLPEPNQEPLIAEKCQYLEPPDVQRQLNHLSLMAQNGAALKANVQETRLPETNVLHCEFCSFSTEHLSSVRRHYMNRHGRKILRCKDCDFLTGLRKTLEQHMATDHSTLKSHPTHHKDFRCPFCLYQTKNKNSMIDHIILHREERVVPIEVRRPKLSRYLQGIVFRCHKCTFSSASAENLRLHMKRHDDFKPYKCRLCYFDCTELCDLEAHLCDKHQVVRNHELVGQVSLDQMEARMASMPREEQGYLSSLERPKDTDVEMEEFITDYNEGTQAKNPAAIVTSDNITDTEDGSESYLQTEDCGVSGKERQTDASQHGDHAGRGNVIKQQKEEAAEGSSTKHSKTAEKAQSHKLQSKALQEKTLNIQERVENDILCQILLLDEDSSIHKIHKRAVWDRTVRMEQNIGSDVVNVHQIIFQDATSNFNMADIPKTESEVRAEVIQAAPKRNHKLENNIRSQECVTDDSSLLCPTPKDKENVGGLLKNCKEEQDEHMDCYGEMPVLDNEYLKEEMHVLQCCKEEKQNDHLEQKQSIGDEMMAENKERRCKDQEHMEGDAMKAAGNSCSLKGAVMAVDVAVDVLRSAVAEAKPFTCEFCGRNFTNGSELERHIMRHGL